MVRIEIQEDRPVTASLQPRPNLHRRGFVLAAVADEHTHDEPIATGNKTTVPATADS